MEIGSTTGDLRNKFEILIAKRSHRVCQDLRTRPSMRPKRFVYGLLLFLTFFTPYGHKTAQTVFARTPPAIIRLLLEFFTLYVNRSVEKKWRNKSITFNAIYSFISRAPNNQFKFNILTKSNSHFPRCYSRQPSRRGSVVISNFICVFFRSSRQRRSRRPVIMRTNRIRG